MINFNAKHMMADEPTSLKVKGAKWFHTHDHHMPNNSKASLGEFFHAVISEGAHVGEIFCMSPKYNRAWVQVSVFMTDDMKASIEAKTKFRFRNPPQVHLNSAANL